MYPRAFNLGHALPLVGTRFWCYAQLRANLRECFAIRDDDAAIGSASDANRICDRATNRGDSILRRHTASVLRHLLHITILIHCLTYEVICHRR